MAELPVHATPAWIYALEEAHQGLDEATSILERVTRPPLDLVPIAQSIEAAWEALYSSYLLEEPPANAVARAQGHLGMAIATLGEAPDSPQAAAASDSLNHARAALSRAQQGLLPINWQPPRPAPELRASQNEPELRELRRPPLPPHLVVVPLPDPEVTDSPRPRPDPKTFEELAQVVAELKSRAQKPKKAAEKPPASSPQALPSEKVRPGFQKDPWPAQTEPEFIRARARDAFDEVSMVGMQRTPLLDDPWRGMLAFERRMMENIDVILALGPIALGSLEELTRHSPVKDPCRLFALTLVMGCVQGRDTFAQAERFFAQEEATDPAYGKAFVSALKLIPHPEVSSLCRRWLQDPSPQHRSMGLEVLIHRGWATPEELGTGSRDEPRVARVALPQLARMGSPDLREIMARAMNLADEAPEDRELFLAVSTALAYCGHSSAIPFTQTRLDGPLEDLAAVQLAILGTDREALLLVDRVEQRPTPGAITGASWGGAVRAIPALIAALSNPDEECQIAAAYGLERLTNAGFWETVEIPPEKTEEVDLPEPDLGEPVPPLAQRLASPGEAPQLGSPDLIDRPTTDLGRWRAYYEQHSKEYSPGTRYRRGRPHSPLISLEELDHHRCTPRERRALQRELVIRTGQQIQFDPDDLVVVQNRALKAWEPIARAQAAAPGTWHRPSRR